MSPTDVRTVLAVDTSWLDLELPALSMSSDAPDRAMLAALRFDERRICLEAVELNGSRATWSGYDVGLRVIARFDERAGAGKVGIEQGAEYRQALSCTLEP